MDSKRILILGGAGMLGHRLWLSFKDQFETYVTVRQPLANYARFRLFDQAHTFDNTDAGHLESVRRCFEKIKPDVAINCIGVIKQLKEAQDPLTSIKINALFPHELKKITDAFGTRLIHISTDCIFSGKKGNYTENDPSDAEDLYGKTKFLGEVTQSPALTLRTSIIGRELTNHVSLLDWFLSRKPREKISGYTQAIYSGFTTEKLGKILIWLIQKHPNVTGLYQVASSPITKYDLLKRLQNIFKLDIDLRPSDAFRCDRSLNGSCFEKVTGFAPPSWDEMIAGIKEESLFYQEIYNGSNR